MLTLRQLAPSLTYLQQAFFIQRFYARPPIVKTKKDKMKYVHQETLRFINPSALIKVNSEIFVKVCSADVHEYPSADVLIAQLHGGPAKNCPASLEVKVSDDERNVEVVVKKLTTSTGDFHIELQVPIKSSLDVSSMSGANVSSIYGDFIKLKAEKYIALSDLKAETIDIESIDGNIVSHGLLLGRKTKVESKHHGHIILDKLHGDELICKSNMGNITTSCCYVESSTFETNSGHLDLKNIHKSTQVHVHSDGNLKMTGVHGNIKVHFNGSAMDLQLSQLIGESYIKSDKAKSSIINISDEIESSTSISANLDNVDSVITLDTSLEHLTVGLHESKQQFKWPLDKEHPHKLQISLKNQLTLGKSSWSDMLRLSMEQNKMDNNNM